MAIHICPYLGLKKDKETVLQFPSTGNYCFHVSPDAPVELIHQEKFCLLSNHINCPIYNSAPNLPMPAEFIGVSTSQKTNKIIILGVSILLILTIMVITIVVLTSNPSQDTELVLERTKTSAADSSGITSDDSLDEGTSMTVSNQSLDTPVVEQTWIQCTPPANWAVYVVKPTDSLVRLALIFNITVKDLQAANCMGDRTLVKPGEKIYVPGGTPTPSATLTPTSTATRTYQAPVVPYWTNTSSAPNPPPSQPKPTNTPLPPPPPTATEPPPPPPTAIPPTIEPPTPTAPPI